MPYRTRSRTTENATVIELSIPMRLMRGSTGGGESHGESDDDVSCYICANSFCATESCGRALTHLACCTQAICCACLVRSSKRCLCKEDCDAVIALCPFCREVSPVEVLDVFMGYKAPCKACAKSDPPPVAPAPVPPPPRQADPDIDIEDVDVETDHLASLLSRLGVQDLANT